MIFYNLCYIVEITATFILQLTATTRFYYLFLWISLFLNFNLLSKNNIVFPTLNGQLIIIEDIYS